MMKNKDFAVFILTHGRPDKVVTIDSLKRSGYTGKVYLIIDNEDRTADEYKKNFGDRVIMFDKQAVANATDEGDNFDDRRTITHARNASFEIAKELGISYFIELDDDYTGFYYKFNDKLQYKEIRVLNLDSVLDSILDFYKSINCASVAMAQNGDFIGGEESSFAVDVMLKRKCMNTFICSTSRKFKFVGRMNEDVNTYTSLGSRGVLFFTIPNVAIIQKQTQSSSGGITEMYKDYGTYVKSFYTVMFAPSCTVIKEMGYKKRRLHHAISWGNAVPKIVSESLVKLN